MATLKFSAICISFIELFGGKRNETKMKNLQQENKEMENQRTNCTTCPDSAGFVFLPTHKKPTRKTQKSNFISNIHRLIIPLHFELN